MMFSFYRYREDSYWWWFTQTGICYKWTGT